MSASKLLSILTNMRSARTPRERELVAEFKKLTAGADRAAMVDLATAVSDVMADEGKGIRLPEVKRAMWFYIRCKMNALNGALIAFAAQVASINTHRYVCARLNATTAQKAARILAEFTKRDVPELFESTAAFIKTCYTHSIIEREHWNADGTPNVEVQTKKRKRADGDDGDDDDDDDDSGAGDDTEAPPKKKKAKKAPAAAETSATKKKPTAAKKTPAAKSPTKKPAAKKPSAKKTDAASSSNGGAAPKSKKLAIDATFAALASDDSDAEGADE